MKWNRLFLALGLCLACVGAQAQWQWVDKDGRKVFSDMTVLENLMLGCHRFAKESFWGQCLWSASVRSTEAELRARVDARTFIGPEVAVEAPAPQGTTAAARPSGARRARSDCPASRTPRPAGRLAARSRASAA
jgi:hypothetical protein